MYYLEHQALQLQDKLALDVRVFLSSQFKPYNIFQMFIMAAINHMMMSISQLQADL